MHVHIRSSLHVHVHMHVHMRSLHMRSSLHVHIHAHVYAQVLDDLSADRRELKEQACHVHVHMTCARTCACAHPMHLQAEEARSESVSAHRRLERSESHHSIQEVHIHVY